MKVYLDNCCFNRPYDDQKQLRIELETKAKLFVQQQIIDKRIEMTISSMSKYENSKNSHEERKMIIRDFFNYATSVVTSSPSVRAVAKVFSDEGLNTKDATHLAFAVEGGCNYFLTTDDKLLKYKDDRISIMNPVEFINLLEDGKDDE
jgi:predicted nucleic acid-binding protein